MITLKDFSPDNIPTQKQVDLLAQFLIENFENEIGKNGNGEGAIEMAVRLLLELKTLRILSRRHTRNSAIQRNVRSIRKFNLY